MEVSLDAREATRACRWIRGVDLVVDPLSNPISSRDHGLQSGVQGGIGLDGFRAQQGQSGIKTDTVFDAKTIVVACHAAQAAGVIAVNQLVDDNLCLTP